MYIAETFSSQFEEGNPWIAADGRDFKTVLRSMEASLPRQILAERRMVSYAFPDGSGIVVTPSGWFVSGSRLE